MLVHIIRLAMEKSIWFREFGWILSTSNLHPSRKNKYCNITEGQEVGSVFLPFYKTVLSLSQIHVNTIAENFSLKLQQTVTNML